jgi:hypothetical protein
MPVNSPEYSIARDYDPYNEILSAKSDPMAAYLTYLADVTWRRCREYGVHGGGFPGIYQRPEAEALSLRKVTRDTARSIQHRAGQNRFHGTLQVVGLRFDTTA